MCFRDAQYNAAKPSAKCADYENNESYVFRGAFRDV